MGIFESKTKTTKNPVEMNPWEPQQDYLTHGFDQAKKALGQSQGNLPNDLTADMNDTQTGALGSLAQGGNDFAQGTAQQMIDVGSQGIDAMSGYQNNAQDLYDQAGQDSTGKVLDNARQYADDPFLQQQIDSALGDVSSAFDRQVGNINNAASGSGNINSTRAGVMEARALDDAQDRAADISSSMRGEAYQTGIDRARQDETNRFQNQMTANQSIGQGAGQAFDFAQGGYGMKSGALQDALTAGDRLQGQNQAEIEGQLQKAQLPQGLVAQYMSTIGGNYGKEGFTSQTSKSASPFQQAVGGAASLMGGWGAM